MTSARRATWAAALLLVLHPGSGPARAASTVLDDFEALAGWTTVASEGARVWTLQEPGHSGMGMRVGFDLGAGGGYVILHKQLSLPLPENYAFTFYLRGEGRRNNFEFKLLDPTGKNVWWRNQRDFSFPTDWQQVTIRKSRLGFAWGPTKTRELKQVGAIELAITAGEGGTGSFWIDDLAFEEREPVTQDGVPPDVQASSSLEGHEPALMLDGDAATSWKSDPVPPTQWVLLDFRKNREYGGLVIDWDPDDYATAFEVQASNDGAQWTTSYSTATGGGGRDYIYMPDAESRFVRLVLQHSSRAQGYGIRTLTPKPFSFSASPNDFFAAIAQDAPAGRYPKYLYGRQTYWTLVGVAGDDQEALLNEEGMLEVAKGGFSVEPFLYADGALVTWQAVTTEQELQDGYLPIPSVTWRHDRLTLIITAFANGEPGASTAYVRYRILNRSDRGEPVRLYLAIRPFQVNPPWQTLNAPGGVTQIRTMRFDGRAVWVDRERAVVSLTPPDHFGAATFEEGSITHFLGADRVPPPTEVSDPLGFASGAFQYNLYLESKGHAEVDLAVPFHEAAATAARLIAADGAAYVAEQQERTRHDWEALLGRVAIELPPEASDVEQTLKTTLAYILINRDGPAIQPGSRNYARSWIRDGAITSSALLEMGFTPEVREFLRWYARYQAPDGKVPCCVDRRGAERVSEHDSPGAFIWAVAEYYRYTRDVGFLHDLWPNVLRAVDFLVALREQSLGEEFKAPDKAAFYGILPASISHEGYAAYPVHSYWDDFFALRGLKDAADLARVMGDEARATKIAALRDSFRQALYASIRRTMAQHGIDFVPGSAELGDFDPTSTSIALAPGGELAHLPAPALARTFDRYWAEFEERRRGDTDWEGYSPYELRNVGTFVGLGEKQRALELLDYGLADRRPRGWNEWPEVLWRDPGAPRFIGDMPHTWVGSGFIRSVRMMLAYERESDQALVLGAGLPAAWVTSEHGVSVKRLPTYHGVLDMSLRAEGADTVRVRLSGDLDVPPGGLVVTSPLARPLRAVTVNGRPLAVHAADSAVVRQFPADVRLEY
ncbi:MAG TPA: discoidin domain-containing protein [Verrucomicrobiae bacterium]|nr:discoidin domain-containing protein [Verrucomicrobiae bacterium]